ncbi:uncharacterized protein [Littorina saxatilis]|uniref:uncharacterized protein n=1 Tax=Littorina saxatilis TaxID=31220 RepID=UPI0038B46C07
MTMPWRYLPLASLSVARSARYWVQHVKYMCTRTQYMGTCTQCIVIGSSKQLLSFVSSGVELSSRCYNGCTYTAQATRVSVTRTMSTFLQNALCNVFLHNLSTQNSGHGVRYKMLGMKSTVHDRSHRMLHNVCGQHREDECQQSVTRGLCSQSARAEKDLTVNTVFSQCSQTRGLCSQSARTEKDVTVNTVFSQCSQTRGLCSQSARTEKDVTVNTVFSQCSQTRGLCSQSARTEKDLTVNTVFSQCSQTRGLCSQSARTEKDVTVNTVFSQCSQTRGLCSQSARTEKDVTVNTVFSQCSQTHGLCSQSARTEKDVTVNTVFSQCSQTHGLCSQSARTEKDLTVNTVFSDSNRRRVVRQLHTVNPVRTIEMKNKAKVAAVLVPFCMVDHEPSVLFTLRSSSLRQHKGEICFPGGNQDDHDLDHIHTALRETFEETGLNPRHFDVWGTVTPTPSRQKGGTVVYPVLARYTQDLDLDTLTLNTEEVEEVFTVSVSELCDASKTGSTQFRTGPGYTLPVFLAGPHRIWGLTAVILHQTMTLIAPVLYTHRIRHVA